MRARVVILLSISALAFSAPAWAEPGAGPGALPPLPTPSDILPPVIQQAPAQIFYGQPFTIVTPDARRIVKVGMLSVGGGGKSVTLAILGRSDTTLRVAAPGSTREAPAGQYLLFIYAQGFGGEPLPSLPALVTLSLPHSSPPPSPGSGSPTPKRSPTPGATKGRGGPGPGGGPVSSGSPATGPGGSSGGQGASAAVATPASSERSIGAAPWLGGLLLILLLATFFGLRRMLRA